MKWKICNQITVFYLTAIFIKAVMDQYSKIADGYFVSGLRECRIRRGFQSFVKPKPAFLIPSFPNEFTKFVDLFPILNVKKIPSIFSMSTTLISQQVIVLVFSKKKILLYIYQRL